MILDSNGNVKKTLLERTLRGEVGEPYIPSVVHPEIRIDSSGRILVAGNHARPLVMRFTPAGEFDTLFGMKGLAVGPLASPSTQSLVLDSDRPIVGGPSWEAPGKFGFALQRFLS